MKQVIDCSPKNERMSTPQKATGPVQNEISSSNHYFLGDMLVLAGVFEREYQNESISKFQPFLEIYMSFFWMNLHRLSWFQGWLVLLFRANGINHFQLTWRPQKLISKLFTVICTKHKTENNVRVFKFREAFKESPAFGLGRANIWFSNF